MATPSRGGDVSEDDQRRFRRRLSELKANGCRVLVTGDVRPAFRARRSRQLFGCTQNRKRILAATTLGDNEIAAHLPEGKTSADDGIEVIRLDDIRSVSVAETYTTPPHVDGSNEFAAFQWRIVDAIARHRLEDDPEPAVLRVGVSTLAPLIDEHSLEAIREFVRIVGKETVRSKGMAHFQLGLESESALTSELLPEVDIHIELRTTSAGTPEHRWTLLDHNVHTEWFPVQS